MTTPFTAKGEITLDVEKARKSLIDFGWGHALDPDVRPEEMLDKILDYFRLFGISITLERESDVSTRRHD